MPGAMCGATDVVCVTTNPLDVINSSQVKVTIGL
jgi:hypothetical protein